MTCPMTWTSAFGRACGVLLDAIVRWLALARINPNVLTFMGLVVNTVAAVLFGYANGDNQARMFRYAGLVIIGFGFFRSGGWPGSSRLQPGHPLRGIFRFRDRPLQRCFPVSRAAGFLCPRRAIFLRGAGGCCDDQRHHGQLHAAPAPNRSSAPAASDSWNARSAWCW